MDLFMRLLTGVLLLCFSVCAISSPAVDLPGDGLVAYYPFSTHETGDISDASGRNNHASLSGTEWVRKGHRAGSLKFDGDEDYLSLKSDMLVSEGNAFTFCAWFCVERKERIEGPVAEVQYSTDHTLYYIGEKDTYSHLILLGSNRSGQKEHGVPEFGFREVSEQSASGQRRMMWIKGPQPLDDGCWHHIAGVSDLAVTTLYVDGVEVRSSDAKTPYRLVGEELRIGKHGDLGTGTAARARPFKGLMDEVAIWNRTLSQEEIAVVMEATQKADPIVEDRSAEMNQIADCLLQGDLDGAGKILEKIEGLGTDEWNSFRQSAEEVLRMPGIVWQAYSSLAGKTTDVYLNSGTKNLYIKAVTDDKVEAEIRIVRGGQVVASAEQNFSYDELSPRDKLVRLGKEQTPELNIMRGILACCAGVPEKAGPYFERAGNALGKTLIERMESNRVAGAVGRFSP